MLYDVGRDFAPYALREGSYLSDQTFYLTTAIDYPNAEPHVGHSLEISVDSWTRTTEPRHFRASTEQCAAATSI